MGSWPRNSFLPILVLALLIFTGCRKKEEAKGPDLGYAYWPEDVGHWVEYNVDSIVYNDFADSVERYSFQLRDEIVETFTDLEGRPTQRVERFRRWNDSAQWELVETHVQNRLVQSAQQVEGNTRYIKLQFPPHAGDRWNGNATNALEDNEYTYDYTDEAETFGTIAFDSVLRVIQVNDTDNFVVKTYAEERYARHAGLVYKRSFHIETQFEVDSGLQYIQVVKDWGPK